MGNTLLAGPWIGEFGWELFCWQGYIRKLSKQFDKTIIIGRPTNGFLYKDFCDEYIKFDPQSFKTDAWNCHGAKSASDIIKDIQHDTYLSGHFDIGMRYSIKGVSDTKGIFFSEQEYHEYQSDISDKSYDVIFHCRNKSTGSDRNWRKEQWIELRELLGDETTVACIGNNEAFHIDGTDDIRNVDLEELVSIMNNSKIVVGPSSGPMHLASLSGTKHLVWSDNYNRVRYQKDWNPFETKVIFYGGGNWNPDPNDIKDLIRNNI
jgi:ADP-heptose:LPS heptosyltransferase